MKGEMLRVRLKGPGIEDEQTVDLDPRMTGSQVADEAAALRNLPRPGVRLFRGSTELQLGSTLEAAGVRAGDELRVVLQGPPAVDRDHSVVNERRSIPPHTLRQGDVVLRPLAEKPAGSILVGDQEMARFLVRGLKTGHTHSLTAGKVYRVAGEHGPRTIVEIVEKTWLVHQEHKHIKIPPGVYEVLRQRAYVPPDPPQKVERAKEPRQSRPAWRIWED